MVSLTHAGCRYRTKPLPPQQAESFARALNANARFAAVSVEPSRSPGKQIVAYVPTSETRQAELMDRERDAREERAAAEGEEYLMVLDPDTHLILCQSASGEVYEVSPRCCSCPDHHYRLERVRQETGRDMRCKHRVAVDAAVAAGRVIGMETIPARA